LVCTAFIVPLSGYKEVLEIPRSQRYVNRPTLETLFDESTTKDKGKRNDKIAQAVLKDGYSQSEDDISFVIS